MGQNTQLCGVQTLKMEMKSFCIISTRDLARLGKLYLNHGNWGLSIG